jgi:hypothetical protein
MSNALVDLIQRHGDRIQGFFRHGRYDKVEVASNLDVWYSGKWAVVVNRLTHDKTHVYPDLKTANHQLELIRKELAQ